MAVRKGQTKQYRRRQRSSFSGAVVIAGAIVTAAFLLSREQKEVSAVASEPIVVAQFDTVRIPVPLEPVPAGVKLKTIRFKQIQYPEHQIPQGAIRDIAPYLEAASVAPLVKITCVGLTPALSAIVLRASSTILRAPRPS